MTTIFVPGQGEVDFPDSMSDDQIAGVIKKQYPLLKGDSKESLIGQEQAKQPERGFMEKAVGVGEAGLSALSAIPASMAGAASGIAANLVSGKFGTPEGTQIASERAKEVSGGLTYSPRGEAGQEYLSTIGEALGATKLGGLPMGDVGAMTALGSAPVAGMAQQGASRGVSTLKSALSKDEPQMAGGGAALTGEARLRTERAEALPVPVKLTKGQRERTFEQQQFERETAKNPEAGKPIRERFAEQNQQILQNFDSWVDQTGAQAGSLRATGQAVTDAVVAKSQKAKAEIREAYTKARESGAMSEEVDLTPLKKYLADHQAEAINAPVLSSVEQKIASLSNKEAPAVRGEGTIKQTTPGGRLSINDLEEVRKMVGKLSGKDATNATFGKEVKSVIDQMTEGKGGEAYKQARKLRAQYGREFEDKAVVNKLMTTKPGTMDRSVAYEDVFSHSILKGSLDDVRALRRTLQTGGDQGKQAWKELQGATVQHLKDEITKNVATDIKGNKVVSPARLDRLVTELDKDGKLDFIFGKKGAQQIRDVNDIAKDVFTAPPGSVNTSNTASILIGLLDTAVSGTAGMPLPIGSAALYAAKKIKARQLGKRVQEALQ